jgi:hypothetical protein
VAEGTFVRPFAFAFMFAFAFTGCAHRAATGPAAAPTIRSSWKTMRAEHRVELDVTPAGGRHERRTLRGVIAVEQPDRFRLRALGPGGITLFDLLSIGDQVKVLQAIRDPERASLRPILESIVGDLRAAFQLSPAPAERRAAIEGDAVVIRDPDRTVRLSRFARVAGQSVPLRLEIDDRARGYTVIVDVSQVALDVPLDPALWKESP